MAEKKLNALIPKIGPLLRMLSSNADGEIVNAVRALLRVLAAAGLDIHVLVERIEHGEDEKLSQGEMQKIYDKGFADGYSTGVDQGRRSAVIAAAMPMSIFGSIASSDVGPGINGHSWLEIAQYCATNKHRITRNKDRDFADSVFDQIASGRSPNPPQASGSAIFSSSDLPKGLNRCRSSMCAWPLSQTAIRRFNAYCKKPPLLRVAEDRERLTFNAEDWDRDWPCASNTGILTRLTPTIDLDLLNELAALAAENMVRELFESCGLYP